ncbi:MAG: peptidylprolyl isomerase [Candidatus Paceibacterota bacterium]|jgi:cyclophilin family peptidyl-prolyl cis-trans isomerase
MNKNIYLISALILVLAVGGVLLAWPKGEDRAGQEQQAQTQTQTQNPTSSQEAENQPAEDNQNKDDQQPMEIKLDAKVNNEITASEGPVMQIDKTADYVALLKTSEGEIKIQLNASTTPITVNSFIYLARKGFYDNTIFHRVLKGFMIQGGDPTGTGTGGPGYKFIDEPFTGKYDRGIVAMARPMTPDSNGSQFFIMHSNYPLPPNYIIFGKVIEGMEAVDKIAEAETKLNEYGNERSVPVNPVKILSAEIFQVNPAE